MAQRALRGLLAAAGVVLAVAATSARAVNVITWTAGPSMPDARRDHTTTLLASGLVLVAGGYDASGTVQASAFLYDPVAATWNATGPMSTPRALHSATVLSDGNVLVVAGTNGTAYLASAEVYVPATEQWLPAGTLPDSTGRTLHSADLLANGVVFVHGGGTLAGTYLSSSAAYNATSNTWAARAAGPTDRGAHMHAPFGANNVLIVAGYTGSPPGNPYSTAVSQYAYNTDTWTSLGSTARVGYGTASYLPSGTQIAIVGGEQKNGFTNAVDVFTIAGSVYSSGAATLTSARGFGEVVALPDGGLLVIGGENNGGVLATTEKCGATGQAWQTAAPLATARSEFGAEALNVGNGTILVVGGRSNNGSALASVEIGCFDGFTGLRCDQCRPNFYGQYCTACQNCNNGACRDGIGADGSCQCDPGWTGALCDVCQPGYWGASCQPCPICPNGTCNDGSNGNGTCSECPVGLAGENCTTCAPNYFGANCTGCPICVNGQCNDGLGGNGTCACAIGATGQL